MGRGQKSSQNGAQNNTLSKNRANNSDQKLGQGNTPLSPSLGARLWKYILLMCRSNCSAPIPPGTPGDITFLLLPQVLITLIFTCPALYNHQNHPFFECPALFYHTHIFSDPGADRGRGGWGQNNLTGESL